MELTAADYGHLVELARTDSDAAFKEALEKDDALGLGIVGVLDDEQASPGRFEALAESHAGSAGVSELILRLVELPANQPEALTARVLDVLGRHPADRFPLDEEQRDRVERLALDREVDSEQRRKALWWLWCVDAGRGNRVSLTILSDASESPSTPVKDRALRNLAAAEDNEIRKILERFALDQFETPTDPNLPAPDPERAVAVLDYLAAEGNADQIFVEDLLTRCAERDMDVRTGIKHLAGTLNLEEIERIVSRLQKDGYVSWLNTYLVPALLEAQPELVAGSVSAGWWPGPCVDTFANHPWEATSDALHVTVLSGIHDLAEADDAKVAIRRRVQQRCMATTSDKAGEMPGIGVRELMRLGLSGFVPTDDESLLASAECLAPETLVKEASQASWKRPERARRLGEIVSQVHIETCPRILAFALEVGSQTALAFSEGLSSDAVSENADELAAAAAEDQNILAVLCRKSEAVANLTLDRWKEDLSIPSFRALRDSVHAESRLESIDEAVVAYDRISTEQRAELLEEMGRTPARLDLLLRVLSDRALPPGVRPSEEDVQTALEVMGDHLEHATDPALVLPTLRVVCAEARNSAVRRAAYMALSRAEPSPDLVQLLLQRERDESPQMKGTVRAALAKVGDVLDRLAGDASNINRGGAMSLLSSVDANRAAVHARSLLTAEQADDRRMAARVLAESGSTGEDVDAIEAVLVHEPAPEVRDEMRRAIRRLKVGDRAAAHETLLETVGLHTDEALLEMNPEELYGDRAEQLVEGLERVARAEGNQDWGTAIDQLNEVAKVLIFRVIELSGTESGASEKLVKAIAANVQDYGPVVWNQQIAQRWPWMRHLSSMHEMRTEHITPRGSMEPHPEKEEEDWRLALGLFKRGGGPCLQAIKERASAES